jgi:hypothetical protein
MSHNKNPFRAGAELGKVFGYVQKKQVVTRKELLANGFSSPNVNIILSPRNEKQTKGDERGNPATYGHLYFMEKLSGKRLRLRWRNPALEPIRQSTKGIKGKVKAEKKAVKVVIPATVTATV